MQFPIQETVLGGLGGLVCGLSFWFKSEGKDGKMDEMEFLKLVRTGVFGAVAGAGLGYAGKGFDLGELNLMMETLGSGSIGLLLDNFSKILWRRFGKVLAEKLGFFS